MDIRAQQPAEKPIDSSLYFYEIIVNPDDALSFNKAESYYRRMYEESMAKSNYKKAAIYLELIGFGKNQIGDYTASEFNLVKSLELIEPYTDTESIELKLRLYNLLGVLYKNLNNYPKSLEYYEKGLAFADSTKDSISFFLRVGNVLRKEGKIDRAIDTLKYALKLTQKNELEVLKSYVLDNLGYTQLTTGDESGIYNLNQSVDIRKKLGNTAALFSSYRHLTQYYIQIDDTLNALKYAKETLSLTPNIKDPTFELEALGLLAQLDDDPRIKRYNFLNDSIKEADLAKQNKYAALKYDVAQEQRQTKQARAERDRQKRLKTIYVLALLLGFLVILGFSIFLHLKRKQKQLDVIRKTEASISKKVHDGLANDTFQVISELQNLDNVPDHILNKLDKIYMETRDISKNHSPLIDGTHFKDQLVSRLNSYKSENFSVITRNLNGIDWEKFSRNKKDAIYMVLGELMTNTRKHSQASVALVSFEQKGKKLAITFKDNGLGNEIKKGNGIQNMEFRIFSLNGTISFEPESGKGLKVQILV
ncbi:MULTISPECIES: tetratricopeptide repeat-containing sensor histidine kinase [unclassified Leeuwenhoekiella]|nr:MULTISPECIES: tetratricopeptide repeat-containing sensor histidine kinase [unclassified Leeuwenhoekiella]|tara:strand:+ start:16853 stop:18457 length:1605 start_codon:yes stop_codon:yes gene_type:complete